VFIAAKKPPPDTEASFEMQLDLGKFFRRIENKWQFTVGFRSSQNWSEDRFFTIDPTLGFTTTYKTPVAD
jgi:hypothetical protein